MAVLKFKDIMGVWHSIPAIQGASAYEQAVAGGYEGTLEDFYLALNEVNAAVQAAEDAEDSASAAAASALQLASGVASPAGTYANYAALVAANPPNTKTYLVLGTNGTAEVDTLTVTGVPTASGNLSITLNGVTKTVAVLDTDTVNQVATKIRAVTFTGWTNSGINANAIYTKNTVGTNTPVVFSAGTTGVTATFTLTTPGAAPTTSDWYYWNGSVWADGGIYQAVLDTDKIEAARIVETQNIINLYQYDDELPPDTAVGRKIRDSHYIAVKPLFNYSTNGSRYLNSWGINDVYYIKAYDRNKNYLSTIKDFYSSIGTPSDSYTFTTPEDCSYVKFGISYDSSILRKGKPGLMLVEGNSLPSEYVPAGTSIKWLTFHERNLRQITNTDQLIHPHTVSGHGLYNLWDYTQETAENCLPSSSYPDSYHISHKIMLLPETTYTTNGTWVNNIWGSYAFCSGITAFDINDISLGFVFSCNSSTMKNSTTFTTPRGTAYARCGLRGSIDNINQSPKLMIVQGDMLPQPEGTYVSYGCAIDWLKPNPSFTTELANSFIENPTMMAAITTAFSTVYVPNYRSGKKAVFIGDSIMAGAPYDERPVTSAYPKLVQSYTGITCLNVAESGATIRDTHNKMYKVVTAGTTGTVYPTVITGTETDGSCVWEYAGSSVRWGSNVVYDVNDILLVGMKLYKCTITGVTGVSAPSHTSGSVINGSATFEYLGTGVERASSTYYEAGTYIINPFAFRKHWARDWKPVLTSPGTGQYAATADFILFELGTNDSTTYMGALGDTVSETYYGSIHRLVNGLMTQYPNALIIPMTLPTNSMTHHAAIVASADAFHIPYIDLTLKSGMNAPITGNSARTDYFGGPHLTQEGHYRIAEFVSGFLMSC